MNNNKRHNAKWGNNEINSLYREYELLEMTPEQIAKKHQRTVYGVLYRLRKEGIIEDSARNGWMFNTVDKSGWVQTNNNIELDDNNCEESEESENENESENEYVFHNTQKISDENEKFKLEINGRIIKLEECMFDMKTMVASLLKKMTNSPSRTPLRSHL